ncbi:hypothetical protein LXA43DRAFT_1046745 [Ganoderma leucocontextum]|nr:hypothetical protein LXA43DRAFT_1046745 [Ganoderma leucocontextum]
MLTAEFTEAVDALIHNTRIPDDALHARAHQHLDVLTGQLSGPSWAERIQKTIPHVPAFTTLRLFHALYHTADELCLVSGKRYVSAAILCACGDRVTPATVGVAPEGNLVQALDHLASTWAAFLLWPFYAYGADDDLNSAPDPQEFWGDSTPTESERMTRQRDRDQQRRWKEQVMARDNHYCFMCGCYDIEWFLERPAPEGADFYDCGVVPIIKREVLAQDAHGEGVESSQDIDIMFGILKGYFGVDSTLFEKTEGPQNTLFVNTSACAGFRQFRWCLHPTETPNHYKIKRYRLRNDRGSRHVTSHITFADHSQSGVDLPDRGLLRLHAALTGVLWRSGAVAVFDRLFFRPRRLPGFSRWPSPSGGAFWRSVVEYEGPETCLEVDLDLSVGALRDLILSRTTDPREN